MLSTPTIDNFRELLRAAARGELLLLECLDADTGAPVAALCAIEQRDGALRLAPFALMLHGDPYRQLIPPDADQLAELGVIGF